jgi:hypothetical protein
MTALDSLYSLLDYECLLFCCDWLGPDLRIGHFRIAKDEWRTKNHFRITYDWTRSQSQSYVTTDGQSASLSWNIAPIWGLRPDFYYCQTVAGFLLWGALWREDGSVVCQTQSAVISLLSVCTICILHVIKCMYIQHIQGLCQFRLSTTDHALSLVAPATTAI